MKQQVESLSDRHRRHPMYQKIDIVMSNLESLEDVQKIFSENGTWRFEFDKDELIQSNNPEKRFYHFVGTGDRDPQKIPPLKIAVE